MQRRRSTALRRLLWFAVLWASGVLAVGILGYAIKLMLSS